SHIGSTSSHALPRLPSTKPGRRGWPATISASPSTTSAAKRSSATRPLPDGRRTSPTSPPCASMRAMTATTSPAAAAARYGLLARFTSFITETHPFALRPAVMALDMTIGSEPFDERDPAVIDRLREPLRRMLLQTPGDFVSLDAASAQKLASGVPEPTPGVSVNERLQHAGMDILAT